MEIPETRLRVDAAEHEPWEANLGSTVRADVITEPVQPQLDEQ